MAGIASFITICGLPYLIWASVTCGKRLDKYGRSTNKWVALAHAFVLYVLIAITLFYSMRFGVLLVQDPDWEGPADVWLSLLFAVLAVVVFVFYRKFVHTRLEAIVPEQPANLTYRDFTHIGYGTFLRAFLQICVIAWAICLMILAVFYYIITFRVRDIPGVIVNIYLNRIRRMDEEE